jgi:putative restriction endonuclease
VTDLGDIDSRVRLAAFTFLAEQSRVHGDELPHHVLARGFNFEGQRVPLLGPQGIFKPAVLPEMPLTITTAPTVTGRVRPYDDEIGEDGVLSYRYRGTNPNHHENVGVRTAMHRRAPLIYLHGVAKGWYVAAWPVFVVADDPARLTFTALVGSQPVHLSGPASLADMAAESEDLRRYATRTTLVRLHQRSFRMRVIIAYRQRCSICRLRHQELLDAAHILPDGHPKGRPVVPNGLSLCRLHHAAFDAHVLGVSPDLEVQVRGDVLKEKDGPMLLHGLQGFHGARIQVPRADHLKPDREFLAERYELFRKAS